jgi:hypothetical protein
VTSVFFSGSIYQLILWPTVFSVRWELNFFSRIIYDKFVVRKVTSDIVLTHDYTRRNAYATYETSLLGV